MRSDAILKWAEDDLIDPDTNKPFKFWGYQRRALADMSRRKLLWWGRRTGKTSIAVIEAMFYAFVCDDWSCDKFRILVAAPHKGAVDNFFQRLRDIIAVSGFSGMVDRNVRGSPQILTIRHPDGKECTITGFSFDSSGNKGLAARGQDANLIILDEADFINKQAIQDVVMPILYTRPATILISVGTPSQKGGLLMGDLRKNQDTVTHCATFECRSDWSFLKDTIKKEFQGRYDLYEREILAYLH